MVLRKKILLVLLPVLIGLTGCANLKGVTLHPIEKSDIQEMKAGEPYTPEKDGWFVSDFYMEEVANARVGK